MTSIRPRCLIAGLILYPWLALAEAPTSRGPTLSIEGCVSTALDATLPGAVAELIPVLSHLENSRRLLAGDEGPEPLATAVSDPSSGRFLLQASEIGLYRVRLSVPGTLPMRSLALPITGVETLAPVALVAATPTEVSVLDSEGRPVAGVWTVARSDADSRTLWRDQGSPGWRVAPRLSRTDAQGRAVLLRLAEERLDVDVHVPGDVIPRSFRGIGNRLDVRLQDAPTSRRPIHLVHGETQAGVVVAVGRTRWPIGELDKAGAMILAGHFDDRVLLQFLSDAWPVHSGWLEPGDESKAFQARLSHPMTGRLVDPEGQPLAGALVWPSWDPGGQITTDDRGRYTFVRPLSPRFEIQGAAPGFATGRLTLTYASVADGQVPDLVLRPPATASGRVVDATGRGISGVSVTAWPMTDVMRPGVIPTGIASDQAGRFELRDLEADTQHRLRVRADGYFLATQDIGGIAPGSRRTGLRLVLTAQRPAFGLVVDVEDRPLADIEVVLRPALTTWSKPQHLRTDADGRFEVAALPAPRVDVIASGEGYAPLTVPGLEPDTGSGPIDLGILVLVPGLTLVGEVVTADGEPVDGAGIWVSEPPVGVERLAWQALSEQPPDATSSEGRFTLRGLGRDQRVDVVVYREGFLPAAARRVAVPAEGPVRVELQSAGRVAGQVVNEAFEPIAGARVALAAAAPPEGVSGIPAAIEHDPEHGTRSGPDGHFEIDHLPSGEVVLEVRAPGFQPAPEQHFEILEGAIFDDLIVVLKRGAVLEGRLTTADGEPVEDALVAVGSVFAQSVADGAFRVEGIPPGRRTVDVRHLHFDRLLEEIDIEPGINVQDFVFASAYRLAGRVVDERGNGLADAVLEVKTFGVHGAWETRTLSDGEGRFRFPRLAEGEYRLTVEKSGWVSAEPSQPVVLQDGDIDDLEVVLTPSGRLSGEILGLDFAELAGVRVEARTDGGRRRLGEVNYEGRYQIPDLAPGDWRVSAEAAEGSRRVEVRVALTSDEPEAYRDLEFEPGLVLSGRVEHEGEPVGAAQIELRGTDVVAGRRVLTSHDGRFRFEALEPGDYRLSVSSRRDVFIHNQDVELESDRDILVELASAGFTGRVVADGGGVHSAWVVLQQRLDAAEGPGEGSIFTVGTDSEGAFRFDRLPAGRFQVRISKDGFAQLEEELEIAAGTVGGPQTFVLEPTSGLELHVRLASGAMPSSVHVTLLDEGGWPVQTESLGLVGGVARFETLRPGDWRALVAAPESALREVRLTVPGEPVEIVLPDAGRLRVRVPDLFDAPRRATLTLEGADGRFFVGLDGMGRPQTAWPVDRGTTTVEGVPAGLWTLRLVDPGGWERLGEVATPGRSVIEVVLN